jgi:hypothetical protein
MISKKIESENKESGAREDRSLFSPTVFVEASSVRQKQGAVAAAVEIGCNLHGLA